MIKKLPASLFLILVPALSAGSLNWDGRFYEQAFVIFPEHGRNSYSGATILDLKLDGRPNEWLRARAEMEYPLYHGMNSGFFPVQTTGFSIQTLNATVNAGPLKFMAGRFLPKWGKAQIFRPLDLFTPQTYLLNAFEYQGIDGISAKAYFTRFGTAEIIAEPQEDLSGSKGSVNFSGHAGTFDMNAVYRYDGMKRDHYAGIAFKGDIFVTLTGEILYRNGSGDPFTGSPDTLKATLGIDYSIDRVFFMAAEYHFDDSGVVDPAAYTRFLTVSGSRMTVGRNYLSCDFHYAIEETVLLGIRGLTNLDDVSAVIFPYLLAELMDNFSTGLSVYCFTGEKGHEFAANTYSAIVNGYITVSF